MSLRVSKRKGTLRIWTIDTVLLPNLVSVLFFANNNNDCPSAWLRQSVHPDCAGYRSPGAFTQPRWDLLNVSINVSVNDISLRKSNVTFANKPF